MKSLPKPVEYDITIPEGLPQLEGTLSRRARVEVALDVIRTLKSRQCKLQLATVFFQPISYRRSLPQTGQLHTSRLPACEVCARGILFLKAVDRFDQCRLYPNTRIDDLAATSTLAQWGRNQAYLIETAFEGDAFRGYAYMREVEQFRDANNAGGYDNRKPLMIAICQNIVDNHGEFKP